MELATAISTLELLWLILQSCAIEYSNGATACDCKALGEGQAVNVVQLLVQPVIVNC